MGDWARGTGGSFKPQPKVEIRDVSHAHPQGTAAVALAPASPFAVRREQADPTTPMRAACPTESKREDQPFY